MLSEQPVIYSKCLCHLLSHGVRAYLIKQLVCNDKIVSKGLLLQLIEVMHKHLLQLVQEKEHRCGIDILPRDY